MLSIYVNDLSQCLSNYFVIQYADDTQLLHTGDVDNISELIAEAENVLSIVKLYFQRNGLLLNENKTQRIFIGSRHCISKLSEDISINFNSNQIVPKMMVKNFGVYFDNYMIFNSHIDEIYLKCNWYSNVS